MWNLQPEEEEPVLLSPPILDKHQSLNSLLDDESPIEAPVMARHKTMPPATNENPLVTELSVLSPGTDINQKEAADFF